MVEETQSFPSQDQSKEMLMAVHLSEFLNLMDKEESNPMNIDSIAYRISDLFMDYDLVRYEWYKRGGRIIFKCSGKISESSGSIFLTFFQKLLKIMKKDQYYVKISSKELVIIFR